jgi:hypothetical protein
MGLDLPREEGRKRTERGFRGFGGLECINLGFFLENGI